MEEIEKFIKIVKISKEIANTYIYNEYYNGNDNKVINSFKMASIIKKKLLKENINTIIVKGYPYRDKREKFYYNKVKILNYWYNLVVCKDILNLRYNTLPLVFLIDDKTINRHFNIEYIKNGVDNFSYMYISKYNFEDVLKNNLIINKKYGKANIYI